VLPVEEPWDLVVACEEDDGFLVRPVDELPGFTDDDDEDPLWVLEEDDAGDEPVEPLGLFCGV